MSLKKLFPLLLVVTLLFAASCDNLFGSDDNGGSKSSSEDSNGDTTNGDTGGSSAVVTGTYVYDDGSGIKRYITLWDDDTGEMGTITPNEDDEYFDLTFEYEIKEWGVDANGELQIIYVIEPGTNEPAETFVFTSTTLTESDVEEGEEPAVYTLSDTLENAKVVLDEDQILGTWKVGEDGESYRLLKAEEDTLLGGWKGTWNDGSASHHVATIGFGAYHPHVL